MTACSMSASLKTTRGDFPPVSRVIFFNVLAADAMIFAAVAVEPVNAILSTRGWFTSADPASLPYPLMKFTTPGGNPASTTSSPRTRMLSGVCSAALSTTVLPQASAGPSFQVAIERG